MLKEIQESKTESYYPEMINLNGTLIFRAPNNAYGSELWRSDGTPNGTLLIKDILSGPAGSIPSNFTRLGNNVYFITGDSDLNTYLYKTDGTASGTLMVKKMGNYSFNNLINVQGKLFFTLQNSVSIALWKSDGTTAGTELIKVLPSTYTSSPSSFTDVNGTLFFVYDTEQMDSELWKSDGTAAGTIRVKDIYPGSRSSNPQHLFNMQGTLLFCAKGTEANGAELWKSDGTEAGTTLVKNINIGDTYSSDPDNFFLYKNVVYFSAKSYEAGQELFRTDGTAAGTYMVKDFVPGTASSFPRSMIEYNDLLYVTANEYSEYYYTYYNGIHQSDGTTEGTTRCFEYNSPYIYEAGGLTKSGSVVYFAGRSFPDETELWRMEDNNVTGILDAPVEVNATRFAFPNPAKEQVTVQSESKAILKIYDGLGSLVQEVFISGTSQISGLAKGCYFFKLIQNGEVKTQKIAIVD